MKVFEITRTSDAKTVYADDLNRLRDLLDQVVDLEVGESVQVTVSGIDMDKQEFRDNHGEDSWDD